MCPASPMALTPQRSRSLQTTTRRARTMANLHNLLRTPRPARPTRALPSQRSNSFSPLFLVEGTGRAMAPPPMPGFHLSIFPSGSWTSTYRSGDRRKMPRGTGCGISSGDTSDRHSRRIRPLHENSAVSGRPPCPKKKAAKIPQSRRSAENCCRPSLQNWTLNHPRREPPKIPNAGLHHYYMCTTTRAVG